MDTTPNPTPPDAPPFSPDAYARYLRTTEGYDEATITRLVAEEVEMRTPPTDDEHHGDPPLLLYHENLHALVKRHGLCPPFKVVNRTVPFRSLLDGRDLCILTSSDVLFTDFFAALLNLVCEGWE